MAQLLLHLANITIYENTFITDSREFPWEWKFPGIPDLLFPFPGNSATIAVYATINTQNQLAIRAIKEKSKPKPITYVKTS